MNGTVAASDAGSPAELARRYLGCLMAGDARSARALVERALEDGVSASSLYLRVITPAMYEIGRLWETAHIGVAQEHLATQISQAVVITLGARLAGAEPVGQGRTAVVSSTPGELHALGGQMVADFLETQGWHVLVLGADVPGPEIAELAEERQAELVALSTALPGHLLSVTRTCQLLRKLARPPFIVVGGRAYRSDEPRALAVGADAFAEDPESLLELLRGTFLASP